MTRVSHQQPLDRPLWIVLRQIPGEPPNCITYPFPNLIATIASKQALLLRIKNRLCAIQSVECAQQPFEHRVSQAELPRDHLNVGRNV